MVHGVELAQGAGVVRLERLLLTARIMVMSNIFILRLTRFSALSIQFHSCQVLGVVQEPSYQLHFESSRSLWHVERCTAAISSRSGGGGAVCVPLLHPYIIDPPPPKPQRDEQNTRITPLLIRNLPPANR